jgi:hypothetical protein
MKIQIACAVGALAIAVAGCSKVSNGGGGASGGANPWTEPGVLRWSEFSDPKSLNPVLNSG